MLFAVALLVLAAGGAAAFLAGRSPRAATRLGAGSCVTASLLGIVPALRSLAGAEIEPLELGWSLPGASFSLAIDPLSAFFLVPIFVLSAVSAVYGSSYLAAEGHDRSLGPPWFWFNGLVAAMALVVTARNALLFLVAWEAMAVASYFLVIFHHDREDVRRAGWTYLAATHLGTAFLLALFALLARQSGSLDFVRWQAAPASASGLFLLALVGFGAKAGVVPLHVWLPEAHPAAPSFVSAVMSGVMIKTGVYGLLRVLSFLGPPPAWWGTLLVGIGLASGVLGVLFALAQHDLKRLLAYHSVENIGICVLGIGLGLLCRSHGAHDVAALAMAGGLLHVWNHALFKGLLFLAAGSVSRAAGSLDLEHLGGLLRRMPWTGATFLLGAAAICALPPLNGFVSEFLVYAAAFRDLAEPTAPPIVPLGVIAGLGLMGGLAAACFAKAAGVVFLGEPRSADAAHASEAGAAMRGAMVFLALACALLGVASPLGLAAVLRPVGAVGIASEASSPEVLSSFATVLWWVSGVGSGVVALAALFALARRRLLRARPVGLGPTWDCGYAAPTSRMQYTASSFAQPLTRLFAPVLRSARVDQPPTGLFPAASSFASHPSDLARDGIFRPLFRGVERVALWLRPLQSGSTHLYVFYVVLAALTLLLWRLG